MVKQPPIPFGPAQSVQFCDPELRLFGPENDNGGVTVTLESLGVSTAIKNREALSLNIGALASFSSAHGMHAVTMLNNPNDRGLEQGSFSYEQDSTTGQRRLVTKEYNEWFTSVTDDHKSALWIYFNSVSAITEARETFRDDLIYNPSQWALRMSVELARSLIQISGVRGIKKFRLHQQLAVTELVSFRARHLPSDTHTLVQRSANDTYES